MKAVRFNRFVEQNPDALAIVDPQEREYSRGALASAANRITRGLRRSGLGAGDVLAIAVPNSFEFMATHFAAMQAGLYVVPINWHLRPAEVQYILENCNAKAFVAHSRVESLARDAAARMQAPPRVLLSVGDVRGFARIDELVDGESDAPIEEPLVGRILSYTSATTGLPKGVLLPLADAARVLDLMIERRVALGTTLEDHVQLCASMLYHGMPLETTYVALNMGHAVVLMDAVTPEAILRLVDRYRVTIANIVPTMFARLLRLDDNVRSRYSLASLQRVTHGGATCPPEVKRRMIEWWGPILWETYGATEGVGTIVGSLDWLKHPGTVGKPVQGSRLKILSDDGDEVSPGEIGTIYLTRHTGDRFEYLGDPEKTSACYRGNFFTVGDVGYVNEEGFLFLCDRKVDMIIRGGMNVYSAEIERVLAAHSGVVDCAVVGIPDADVGEAIMAIVQPAAGVAADEQLRSDIVRFLLEHLSAAKIPTQIVFTDKLPRDDTGKLKKRTLRDIYWQPNETPEPRAETADARMWDR
jgi:long-chain acyl-CoA synthetase